MPWIKRHAGSTFKPIVDYGPAIEYLKWGTYQTIVDEPHTYSGGTEINNWDGKHMGPMSMREALARSRNIPALKTLQEVGTDKALEFTNKLGIPMKEMYESYSIGAYEVSSLQVAGAYSAFGNNGFYTEPHAIKQIEMRDGTKLDLKPESEVVMKDYTAFMISDMLKSVVKSSYGTGRLADVPGLPVAGKQGLQTIRMNRNRNLEYLKVPCLMPGLQAIQLIIQRLSGPAIRIEKLHPGRR